MTNSGRVAVRQKKIRSHKKKKIQIIKAIKHLDGIIFHQTKKHWSIKAFF